MNINPSNYNSLLTVKKSLAKNSDENTVFTKKSLEDLTKSADKEVSQAANQVLQDKELLKLIDNGFSGRQDLNDGQFVMGELNAALISLNPKNAYRADLEALSTIKDELVAHHGSGPWDKTTLQTLSQSTDPKIQAAAKRILKDGQLFGLVDNGFSGKQDLNDGKFQVGELDAALVALNPLNPQMQNIETLKTIAQEIKNHPEKYPDGVMTKADLEKIASAPAGNNPTLKAAATKFLNQPGLFAFTENGFSGKQDLNDGKFQLGELQAVIQDLNPLSPKMQDVVALRKLAAEIQANPKAYPDGVMTKQQLQQLVGDSNANPSIRAAANRLLNNPNMLQLADNAFSGTQDLNDGKFQAGELIAAAQTLHPLSYSSRTQDTLQTIKNEILAHPDKYPNGVMTKDQLAQLQQTGSPGVRQAATRLLRTPKLLQSVDNNFSGPADLNDNRFQVGELDAAMNALSPYNPNERVLNALRLLRDEITNNPEKYPNGVVTKAQFEQMAKSGPPTARQAATTLLNNPDVLNFMDNAIYSTAYKNDRTFQLDEVNAAISFFHTLNAPVQDYSAVKTLYNELQSNTNQYPNANGVFNKNTLSQILADPKASPNLKSAAARLLDNPKIFSVIDNGNSGPQDLNDGKFTLDEMGKAMNALNPANPKLQDLRALETLQDILSKHPDYADQNGVFTQEALQKLIGTSSPSIKAAAIRVMNDPKLFSQIDNANSGPQDLNDGKFVLAELQKVIDQLYVDISK